MIEGRFCRRRKERERERLPLVRVKFNGSLCLPTRSAKRRSQKLARGLNLRPELRGRRGFPHCHRPPCPRARLRRRRRIYRYCFSYRFLFPSLFRRYPRVYMHPMEEIMGINRVGNKRFILAWRPKWRSPSPRSTPLVTRCEKSFVFLGPFFTLFLFFPR